MALPESYGLAVKPWSGSGIKRLQPRPHTIGWEGNQRRENPSVKLTYTYVEDVEKVLTLNANVHSTDVLGVVKQGRAAERRR